MDEVGWCGGGGEGGRRKMARLREEWRRRAVVRIQAGKM